jgi:hypothetical protein
VSHCVFGAISVVLRSVSQTNAKLAQDATVAPAKLGCYPTAGELQCAVLGNCGSGRRNQSLVVVVDRLFMPTTRSGICEGAKGVGCSWTLIRCNAKSNMCLGEAGSPGVGDSGLEALFVLFTGPPSNQQGQTTRLVHGLPLWSRVFWSHRTLNFDQWIIYVQHSM